MSKKSYTKTEYIVCMGLMFASMMVLSLLEGVFSPILPPGVRIGLPNIAVLSAATLFSLPSALILVILKALFGLITRGFTAGLMSLCGGLLSFAAMALLIKAKEKSLIIISVTGAVLHSLGQLCVSALITGTPAVLYYAPLMLIVASLSGTATGMAARIIIPSAQKILSKGADAHPQDGKNIK